MKAFAPRLPASGTAGQDPRHPRPLRAARAGALGGPRPWLGFVLLGLAGWHPLQAAALTTAQEPEPARLVLPEAGFSVTAPGADWTCTTSRGLVTAFTCVRGERKIAVQVVSPRLHAFNHGLDMESFAKGLTEQVAGRGGEVRDLLYEPSAVPQPGSYRVTFSLRPRGSTQLVHFFAYVTVTAMGAAVTILSLTLGLDEPDELRQLAGSFTVLGSPADQTGERGTAPAPDGSGRAERIQAPPDRREVTSPEPPSPPAPGAGLAVPPAARRRVDTDQVGRIVLYYLVLAALVILSGIVNSLRNRPTLNGFRIAMLVIAALLGCHLYWLFSRDSLRGLPPRERPHATARALGQRLGEAFVPFAIAGLGSRWLRKSRAAR